MPSFWDWAFRLPLSLPPPPAAHRAPPAAPPAGAAAAAGLAAAATEAAAPVAPKGRFQRPVTSFFKAPATAEEKQRAAEQQAKEVEASRGKLQESAMEREKRPLELILFCPELELAENNELNKISKTYIC